MPDRAALSVAVSGQCPMCSWRDQYVFHDTPWCPSIPAIADVDWNAGREVDGKLTVWSILKHMTRPSAVGEVVLLLCEREFVTWGRVIEITDNGVVTFEMCAETGVASGFCYIDEATLRAEGRWPDGK